MQRACSVTKDHSHEINQTPRKTLVHCSGSASRDNSVQGEYLQQKQIQAARETNSYHSKIKLSQ